MSKFLDAALNGAVGYAGKAYFFKGAKYVRYDWTKEQGDPGYPLGLDEWGFPAPFDKGIDAAIEGRETYEKKAFFFKDDKYIRYDWAADKIDSGYPKSIDAWELPKDFFGGKKKLDAVINGAGESARYCYLFSGTNWVRIDWKEEEDPVLHKGGFPKDWDLPGEIAKGIDAALSGGGKKYGGKAYFFADKKYARYDWSGDKCDVKNGELGAWKLSWDDAGPEQQKGVTGEPSATPTDGPSDTVPQPWNGQTGKLWLPSSASGKLPLVVYLHGLIKDPKFFGAAMMLADDALIKKDGWAMNVGNLAGYMIAKGWIKPLAVAAPSDKPEDRPGGNNWKSLDLGAFIDDVTKKVRAQGADIDLDQVAVVGWSGAGCFLGNGLDKVAHQGGKFSAGGSSHTLKILGLADTLMAEAYSKSIKNGLKGNNTTIVYSVHKDGGGGHAGPDGPYVKGFDLHNDLLKSQDKPLPSPVEDADRDAFALFMDNGDQQNPPTCTVAHVGPGSKGIDRHWSEIVSGAKAAGQSRPAHGKMPLVWTWYALQRYFHK